VILLKVILVHLKYILKKVKIGNVNPFFQFSAHNNTIHHIKTFGVFYVR